VEDESVEEMPLFELWVWMYFDSSYSYK
jgi:hypothetical protein